MGDALALENGLPNAGLGREDRLAGSANDPQNKNDEAELLEGCRRGDASAFERLFEAHGMRMKSVAANLLGNVSDAEDAVQESFLKVYRGAASFRGASRLSTWLYRVLLNTCYDLLRRRLRHPESAPEAGQAELRAAGDDHPLRLDLEAAVARLAPRRRMAFLLFEVEGFSHREVGEILGVPEGNSRVLLHEAKRELQRLLSPRGSAREARA
ncbi:MAG TPA: RNA polymerase sigma factor [Thermoanaerobaculia bacterium]|nr:RNA polymerase sigma factor [Thermoanaerobaculia bacterium]